MVSKRSRKWAVVALALAIVDTIETGRVFLFSRQFLEELPRRWGGRRE